MDKPAEQSLWFLAILPPTDVADRVRAVQQEIADRFGPRKILRIPVHVTLEAPFRLNEEDAARMTEHLRVFFAAQPAFQAELKNFGTFRHSVVFLEVVPNLALLELHNHTSALLRDEHAYIQERTWQQGYTPHVTVANRDVTPQAHRAIWAEFNTRKFYAKFAVEEIHLLRHTQIEENSVVSSTPPASVPLGARPDGIHAGSTPPASVPLGARPDGIHAGSTPPASVPRGAREDGIRASSTPSASVRSGNVWLSHARFPLLPATDEKIPQ